MALESYITSIQHVEINLSAAETSDSANLGSSTVVTNCIPFLTMKVNGTSDDWDAIMCDVYLTAGSPPTITIERNVATGTIDASIFIIEFDGINVKVQQGTWDLADGETTTQELITEITLTKAFAIAYHRMGVLGDDDWDYAMTKCWFSDSTHIDFERDEAYPSSTQVGHWYLAEAQGAEFTTQSFIINLGTAETKDSQVITSVTMSKTMVVGSFECNITSDDTDISTAKIWLEDATHVSAERQDVGGWIDARGWVIEFAAGSNVSVQRNVFYYADSDAQETTDITAVTQANSIINNPSYYGLMRADGLDSAEVEGAFQKLTFVDNDTIVGDRTAPVEHAYGEWEVIDFTAAEAGWSGKVYGIDNPAAVIGVETIEKVIGV